MRENIIESFILVGPEVAIEQNDNIGLNEANFAGEALRLSYLLGLQTLGMQSNSARARAYEIANGSAGAEILSNKYLFGQLVNELGYKAPKSALYHTVGRFQPALIAEVEELDIRAERFCKPLNETKGRGSKL